MYQRIDLTVSCLVYRFDTSSKASRGPAPQSQHGQVRTRPSRYAVPNEYSGSPQRLENAFNLQYLIAEMRRDQLQLIDPNQLPIRRIGTRILSRPPIT